MITLIHRIWRAVAPALVLALLLAACGGDDAATTTTIDPGEDMILSSGTLPETVPEDFPIPDEAVVGSTLVVRSTGTTEVILRLPVEVPVAVSYFEQNLELRGFELATSEATSDGGWDMAIVRDDVSGSLDFSPATPQVTQVVLRLTAQ